MTISLRSLLPVSLSFALVAGCGAAPEDSGATGVQEAALAAAPDAHHHPRPVLDGAWSFVSSDLTPTTAYSINGDEIDLDWSGYYSWNGTWAGGYAGYTFARPAHLVEGATYTLTFTVSNASNPIPVVLKASLSGAGAEQSATLIGTNTATMSFTVSSCPGAAPVLDVVAHPVLGHLGPVEGTGILVQSYGVHVTLTKN